MRLLQLIRSLLSIYSLLLILHFALPYVTSAQQPWMTTLSRICEPGIRIGNQVAARLMPERRFKIDVGPLAAVLVCYVARIVLGFFC